MEVVLQDDVAVKAKVVVCLEIAPGVQDDLNRLRAGEDRQPEGLTVMVIKQRASLPRKR
jgi:hypothetical protein